MVIKYSSCDIAYPSCFSGESKFIAEIEQV